EVNGQSVDPWRPPHTGRLNPDYGFVHFFGVGLDLPKGFSIEADYFLFNLYTPELTQCGVPGVPTANLCTDGKLVGDARNPAQRDSEWLFFEVDWKPVSWG